jgi:hypothetical protein
MNDLGPTVCPASTRLVGRDGDLAFIHSFFGNSEVQGGPLPRTYEVWFHRHRFEIFVGEHVPPHRLGWSGIGSGVQLYQAWLLTPVEVATHVVTENVVRGAAAKSPHASSPLWAQRLNSLWPAQLKRLSESPPENAAGRHP